MKKRNILILVTAALLTWLLPTWLGSSDNGQSIVRSSENEFVLNQVTYSLVDPNSLWVLVNKESGIPLDFVPADLTDVAVKKRRNISDSEQQLREEPARRLEQMFADASAAGHELELSSAFRSSFLQTLAYEGNVRVFGKEVADTFSAEPGKSEHQTGLAVDVSSGEECYIEACFGETPAGLWVAQNAYKYGFIIRYFEGSQPITGYAYEPWHLRYVGNDLAVVIHERQVTLEELFESLGN